MPLVIINFEGIIGEVLTLPLFSEERKKGLYLKNGVVENMKRLLNKFRLVLVTSMEPEMFEKVLKYFKTHKIKFDAAYSHPSTPTPLFSTYTHIYSDFNIPPEDVKWNVLILCPILLQNSELKSRKAESLIFDPLYICEEEENEEKKDIEEDSEEKRGNNGEFNEYRKKEFYVRNLPKPKDMKNTPVTLLVPHYLAQEENKSM